MDREDAALVVRALKSRINGAREDLDELAASSLMHLSACASLIAKRNTDNWQPATAAAAELMAICRQGGKLADVPLKVDLQPFIDCIEGLAAEPVIIVRNRAARRFEAAKRPRLERIQGRKLIGFGARN